MSAERPMRHLNPWWPTIRRAFEVPDNVSDEHARQVIARHMMKAKPVEVAASQGSIPISWEATFEPALRHVEAFLAATDAGALDLPLCGLGTVTGSGVHEPQVESKPEEDAVGSMRSQLKTSPNDEWLVWLWRALDTYVSQHPFGRSEDA